MHAVRIERDSARAADLTGLVLCHELRADDGRVAIPKGRRLDDADSRRAMELAWSELHLLALDDDDVHENDAGDRIARLIAGDGVEVKVPSGGHWPIAAVRRGLLTVDVARLEQVNQLEGPCVYSLDHGQVVEAGEVVARAKIIPFAVPAPVLEQVEGLLVDARGVIGARPFVPHTVGAIVHASMGERAVNRFREAVSEKIGWFGSALCALEVTAPRVGAIVEAFAEVLRRGAQIVLVAGTKAMDVLDPTFTALGQIGAKMISQGVPAHPGSLLWLAELNGVAIVGMPTCGLFAQATVFDLVAARLMTGERLGRRELSTLGHGGFLTRDMAFRLPAYRAAAERGTVE
jgi:hypothetical protein